MTDFDPSTWPQAPVGAVRLWDSGVTWREIETIPGVFDFSRLDAQVDTARANGADVLLVLGQTPRFHATKPGRGGYVRPGRRSMPTHDSVEAVRRQVVRAVQGSGRRLPGLERGQRLRVLAAGRPPRWPS